MEDSAVEFWLSYRRDSGSVMMCICEAAFIFHTRKSRSGAGPARGCALTDLCIDKLSLRGLLALPLFELQELLATASSQDAAALFAH